MEGVYVMNIVLLYLFIGILLTWFVDHLVKLNDFFVTVLFIVLWPITLITMIYAFLEAIYENLRGEKHE